MTLSNFSKTQINLAMSNEILHIATNCKNAHTKIMHDGELNPFAYAIGFGRKSNASVIIGGNDSTDELSSRLLLCFAKTLADATETNSCIMGIDINEVFKRKGIWIVPKMCDIDVCENAVDTVCEKLNPRQLIHLSPFGESVSFYSPSATLANTRLFAFLLAVSCDYYIEENTEDNLCQYFSQKYNRASYSFKIGKEMYPSVEEFREVFYQTLESLLLFSTY